MEKVYNLEKDCCGCSACANICPKNAIEMKENHNGFLYPVINQDKCINCGLCKKICNFKIGVNSRVNLKSYVAVSTDKKLLTKSASGGVFASIAKAVIEADGIVYGATLIYESEKIIVKHIGIGKIEELQKLQGSKYVQSSTNYIYKEIKTNLENDKIVLFSGTPCQVNGLKQFLGKKYDKLYTVDIICHGVPSLKMFNDYVKMIENKKKIKISNVIFRAKEGGWGLNGYFQYYDKKKKIRKMKFYKNESSYYHFFLNGIIYRDSCYNCLFASEKRAGDITIGDYWGIEKEHPELLKTLDKQKGISCLIINNKKGEELIANYNRYLNLYDTAFEKIQKNNAQLKSCVCESKERAQIFDEYHKNGYDGIERYFRKKLGISLYKIRMLNFAKNLIKRFFITKKN